MIVIATTFRSFGIGENDKNQKSFITSLENQSKDLVLSVTQFGEVGVSEELVNLTASISECSPPWSLSQVLINAVKKYPNHNIIWSNADLGFEPNFIEKVEDHLQRYDYLTSWPYVKSNGTFKSCTEQVKTFFGLDFLAISNRITQRVSNYAEIYPNKSWGLFEHQIVCYSYLAANRKRGFNMYKESKVIKYFTPHEEIGEPNYFLRKSWQNNLKQWHWIDQRNFRRIWLNFGWVALKFRGTPIKYNFVVLKYLFRYSLIKIYKAIVS
jgi:hypothetical protein